MALHGYDHAGPKTLKLLDGIKHTPGLRWEVIDLGANHGSSPSDVRDPKTSTHAGILAAAALHPAWVRSMDGDRVPHTWLPGYQVSVPDDDPWRGVPFLNWYRGVRKVTLGCYGDDNRFGKWSVPSSRE